MDKVLAKVANITDFTPYYILASHAWPLACKHGEDECAGNKQQLCVYEYAPQYQGFFKFLMCQNAQPQNIGSLPFAEKCLTAPDMVIDPADAEKARTCYNGFQGEGLLRSSASETTKRGITTSCTIWINKEPRCVHDGGVWYDCPGGPEVEDFVQTICQAYWADTGVWPTECSAAGLQQPSGKAAHL